MPIVANKPVKFSEIPDGSYFYLAQTYAYGGRTVFQKVMEDSSDYNAVYAEDGTGVAIPTDRLVLITQG